MLQSVHKVNGTVLWANMHLLFWLSLIPFTTSWMGENHFSMWLVALYGFDLLMAAIAYFVLAKCLVTIHGKESTIGLAIGKDRKRFLSIAMYILGITLSFVNSWIGFFIYVIVALMWFIPDIRIEKKLEEK